MQKLVSGVVVAGLIGLMGVPIAGAQEEPLPAPDEISVATPFVGVSLKPGDTASFPIEVGGPAASHVELTLDELPDGWQGRIQGGGFVVNEVLLDQTGRVSVDLSIDIPAEAAEGTYGLALVAEGNSGSDRLDLSITVAVTAGGEVTLSTEFPILTGASESTYKFNLQLDNGTPQDIQFGLTAEGPSGWQIEIRPAGESRAATVTVGGGESTSISVDVDPPDTAPAGRYVVVARADGRSQSASVDLGIEITGRFDADMATTSGVLNLEVNAGQPADLGLIVVNTGSAPLLGMSLSASPPSGWDVDFAPAFIDLIAPGDSVPVAATIIPADNAINGDYVLTLNADTAEVRATTEIRATVETSAAWGVVGVGVIVMALVGLTLVFRHYGRR
jgi:uncharacterized membrane protein